jgi:hypothetical protein
MELPKFWPACLIITVRGGSGTTATVSLRRNVGRVRTRGGSRIPAICMVAMRRFIAALSAALRTVSPKA